MIHTNLLQMLSANGVMKGILQTIGPFPPTVHGALKGEGAVAERAVALC